MTSSSKKTYWSNITWLLLHIFPKTFTEDFYNSNKREILNLMYEIAVSVPCPICSKHSVEHLKKYNFFRESINKTPTDLYLNVFKFHNTVNKMLNKPLFNVSDLVYYDNLDFLEIYKEWFSKYTINMVNLELSYHKRRVNAVRMLVYDFVKKNVKKLVINKTGIKTLNVPNFPPPETQATLATIKQNQYNPSAKKMVFLK